MQNCTEFPVRQSTNVLYYASHVILIPVLLGVGLTGNGISAILCNHASVRKENAVFIHLCGLAILDLISLLCTVPGTIQEIDVFPINVTYSHVMAYFNVASYVLGNTAHHAALWILATTGFLQLRISKSPYDDVSRLSRNSTNRIVVFIAVLVCALLNFPRFLEASVGQVRGHCFDDLTLWHFRTTAFGSDVFITQIYPWIVVALGYALPLLLILVAALSLGSQAGWGRLCRRRLSSGHSNDDKRRLGLVKAVWVLLVTALCLELPKLAVEVYTNVSTLLSDPAEPSALYSLGVVTDYLGWVRASLAFVILTVYSSDFRKALRRSFCCLCRCADEFYEPCACCKPSYRRELKQSERVEKQKLKEKQKRKAKRAARRGKSRQKKADGDDYFGSPRKDKDIEEHLDMGPYGGALLYDDDEDLYDHHGYDHHAYDPYSLSVPGRGDRSHQGSLTRATSNSSGTQLRADKHGNPWV